MPLTHSYWTGRSRMFNVMLMGVVAFGVTGCLNYVYKRLKPEALPVAVAPAILPNVQAQTCGVCHQEIYQEWSGSMMAKAFTDPVFQVDWAHDNRFYYCLNCHAPLLQQQPNLVSGLDSFQPLQGREVPNPEFDEALQAEGVTCVVCHLNEGKLEGPFETNLAPHPVRAVSDFASAQRCVRCHQIPQPPFSREPRAIIDTVHEWQEWQVVTGDTRTCTECHMPAVKRPLVAGMPVREGRAHTFPGAWDDRFVRTAAQLVAPKWDGDEVRVGVQNLAGHRFPSGGAERGVQVKLTAYDASSEVVFEAMEWFVRVEAKRGVKPSDSTLKPNELRAVSFRDPALIQHAQRIELSLHFDRLIQHPEIVEALGWPDSKLRVSLETLELTRP